MELNKNEFKALVMLYAAHIDGHVQAEEMEMMIEKNDESTFKKMFKAYKSMSDIEVLDCIQENKHRFIATPSDTEHLMDDMRAIVAADERCSPMEKRMLKTIEKILAPGK